MCLKSIPEDRCGFVLPSAKRTFSGLFNNYNTRTKGRACCWRETWKKNEQCIWHTDTEQKPVRKLKSVRSKHPETIEGIKIANTDIKDNIQFVDCRLYSGDLSKGNLQKCSFNNSDLSETNLSRANLKEANFEGSDLSNADIGGSNLYKSKLRKAILEKSNLKNSSLQKAKSGNSDFRGANLENADLSDSFLGKSDFRDANLCNARLYNAVLEEANFEGANLQRANLGGVSLVGANLSSANLSNANLYHSDIASGDISQSNLKGADLIKSNLTRADISQADLEKSSLWNANLERVQINDSNLKYAGLQNTSHTESSFQNSDLKHANIEDASFIRTDLRGATFTNARFYQTHFSDVRINSDTEFGDTCIYENPEELDDNWEQRWEATPTEAAVWTYRRLQDLHEKYALTERARHYHIKKKEAQKRRHREEGNYLQYAIHAINGVASKHGESPWRVVGVSGVVIAIWSVLYLLLGKIRVPEDFSGTETIGLGLASNVPIPKPFDGTLVSGLDQIATSIYFSVVTFTTLGYGDLQPATGFAQALATVESFIGALLMAYLVFVLGRRTNW